MPSGIEDLDQARLVVYDGVLPVRVFYGWVVVLDEVVEA